MKLVAPNGLQPYDLLNHDLLVLSKDAVARLSHTLDPEKTPVARSRRGDRLRRRQAGEKRSSAAKPAAQRSRQPRKPRKKPAKKKGKE